MNIDGIYDSQAPAPVGKAGSMRPVFPDRSSALKGMNKDQVDMSNLSKMMARSAQAIEDELAARPEKIAQFKGESDTTPKMSNSIIDSIFHRMTHA